MNIGTFTGDVEIQARCYCKSADEVMLLLDILIIHGYLDAPSNNTTHKPIGAWINVKGVLRAEELVTMHPPSAQGFVAMAFDKSMSDVWLNGFEPAIRAAGFLPFRIDGKDYIGSISDEIIAEIRRSRFVIADYTSQRNGVYFEAGFALGLGLTVIPTCKEDEIEKLHFDIRHLNTLPWKTLNELVVSLSRRIRAVVGSGPNLDT